MGYSMFELELYPNENEVTKNECCEHDILFNILQLFTILTSIYSLENIRFVKLNDEALKNNQIAFLNPFWIKKY